MQALQLYQQLLTVAHLSTPDLWVKLSKCFAAMGDAQSAADVYHTVLQGDSLRNAGLVVGSSLSMQVLAVRRSSQACYIQRTCPALDCKALLQPHQPQPPKSSQTAWPRRHDDTLTALSASLQSVTLPCCLGCACSPHSLLSADA